MLVSLFMQILKMSLTASAVILLICLLRLFLRKAPKIISYLLWSVVLFRLLCPFSFSLPVSVIPDKISSGEYVSQWSQGYVGDVDIIHDRSERYQEAIDAGRKPVFSDNTYYVVTKPNGLDEPQTVENTVLPILGVIWVTGIVGMLLWALLSYRKLRHQLIGALRQRRNIYIADHIESPFVMGLVHPKIYLPSSLSRREQSYIVLHEQQHIKRFDHVVKLIAFFALSLHWFNPFVWLAYSLLCKDMEMSCDEAVVQKMGSEIRADYCTSLLNLATGRKFSAGAPLMFGEADAKARIKNIAAWKKPSFWVILLSVIVCITAAVCLLTNQKEDEPDLSFLALQNAASAAAQQETISVHSSVSSQDGSTQTLTLSGKTVGAYLDSEPWTEQPAPVSVPRETDSLEFLIMDGYRVTVYENPRIANIAYQDEIRWYRIGDASYQNALALLEQQSEASAEPPTQPDSTWPYDPIDKTKPIAYSEDVLRYWDYFSHDGQFVTALNADGDTLTDQSIAVYSYLSAFYHTEGADHAQGLPVEQLKKESLKYFGKVPASYENSMLEKNPSSGNILPTGWDLSSNLYLLKEKETLPDGNVRAVFSVYFAYDGSSEWPISAQEYEYALLSNQLNCLPPLEPLTAEMILTEKTDENGTFYVQYHSIRYQESAASA